MNTMSSPSLGTDIPASRAAQPSASARFVATIRSFLMLLGLEIRRSQGYWLLPVMVALSLYSSSYRSYDQPGLTLWYLANNSIMQSYVVIGSFAAALGAWLADRDRRRRISGLLDSVPVVPFRRDLTTMGVAAFWGLAGYGIVGGWFAWQGFTEATWGGADVPLIATGALAIILFTAIGVLAGRLLPNKLTPILTFLFALMLTVGSDLFKLVSTGTNEYGTYEQVRQPFKLLMPWGLTDAYPDVYFSLHAATVGDSLLWLAGVIGVVMSLLALRTVRTVAGWLALAGSMVLAGIGAFPLVDRQLDPDLSGATTAVPYELSCQARGGFEICLHPAYESKLGETADLVGTVFAPIQGLNGVPSRWEQSSPVSRRNREEIGVIDQVGYDHSLNNAMTTIFPIAETSEGGYPQQPASQLVIMNWLVGQSSASAQRTDWFGWPAEVPVVEQDYGNGSIGVGPDQEALAAFQPQMDAAQARFAALPETEQRAWLEDNWDALRAGDLALDDLP